MSQEIQKGDVVQLKSGGPKMTVEDVDKYSLGAIKDEALCKWFDGEVLKEGVFALSSLKKVGTNIAM